MCLVFDNHQINSQYFLYTQNVYCLYILLIEKNFMILDKNFS